jgi:AraC-like DNA-binding protein
MEGRARIMHAPFNDLDRLLLTTDVAVQSFAIVEVKRGYRVVGSTVDAIMIHYVLAGTMHMEVPGFDPIVCGPGCVALLPPGLTPTMAAAPGPAQEVVGLENTRMREGLLVMDAAGGEPGDLRIAAGVVLASVSGSFGLLDRLDRPIAESSENLCAIGPLYDMMLEELASPRLGSRALTSSLMKTCLLLLLRRFLEQPGADSSIIGALGDPRLNAAVSAVLERPEAPHTVASLAACAAMSRSSFARAFRDGFDVSPMEFVAKTRLRHAADLLQSTLLPIKVIAGSTGFSSRSHFSKAFRDAYGRDPSSFREEANGGTLGVPAPLRGSPGRFGLPQEPDGQGAEIQQIDFADD